MLSFRERQPAVAYLLELGPRHQSTYPQPIEVHEPLLLPRELAFVAGRFRCRRRELRVDLLDPRVSHVESVEDVPVDLHCPRPYLRRERGKQRGELILRRPLEDLAEGLVVPLGALLRVGLVLTPFIGGELREVLSAPFLEEDVVASVDGHELGESDVALDEQAVGHLQVAANEPPPELLTMRG